MQKNLPFKLLKESIVPVTLQLKEMTSGGTLPFEALQYI